MKVRVGYYGLRRERNSPENARRAKSDGQQTVNFVGCNDYLFSFCLGLVVGIQRFLRERNAFVDVNQVLAIEDHTRRASVDEFWNLILLGGGNDRFGAIYIDLPVESWVLEAGDG